MNIFEGYPAGFENVFGDTPPIELSDFMSHKRPNNLLTPAQLAAKTAKSIELFGEQYEFFILYIAPAELVKGVNFCKGKSFGCEKACLYTAGRGKFTNVQEARINKGKYLRDETDVFLWQLVTEIDRAIDKAKKKGKKAVFRLNGTTDINWPKLLTGFFGEQFYRERPDAIFYEYTKLLGNVFWSRIRDIPVHYTFSRSEINQRQVDTALNLGINVAAVFNALPAEYKGVKVIDGDTHDARFLDEKGVVVGLTAKGEAKKDTSGFTINTKQLFNIAG